MAYDGRRPNGNFDGQVQKIRIKRMSEKELDEAIADNLERGYELVKRGYAEKDYKTFDRNCNKIGNNLKFVDSTLHTRCWAEMKRLVPSNQAAMQ